MKRLIAVAILAVSLTACHALPMILPALMALPGALKDVKAVADPIDTGISAAVPIYQDIRARVQAEGLDKRDATIASLIAYGDSIANQPVPKGPVGTAVWLVNIAHDLAAEYHKRHPATAAPAPDPQAPTGPPLAIPPDQWLSEFNRARQRP